MTKLTIPTADWSGDMMDIKINEAKSTVTVNGNVLKLVLKSERVSDHRVMELCEVYFADMQLCTGYFDSGYWYLDAGDVERDHKNVYAAAAQMAQNLI